MMVERAEELDRQALWPARAEIWRGVLSSTQYVERNIRIYSHPYGRKKVVTWLLRGESGDVLSSCDTLQMDFFENEVSTSGRLIASVYTPPAHRGRDYARTLLAKAVLLGEGTLALHSDLKPRYYETLGFVDMPILDVRVAVPVSAVSSDSHEEAVAPIAFAKELLRIKRTRSTGGVTTILDEELLDWNIERYRYFAELVGVRLPSEMFWLGSHGGEVHAILGVPHFLENQLDGLIITPGCSKCIEFLGRRAKALGLGRIHYWAPDRTNGGGHPMIRTATLGSWHDQTLIEYW